MLLLLATELILDTNTGCKHLARLAVCVTFASTSNTCPFYVFCTTHFIYTMYILTSQLCLKAIVTVQNGCQPKWTWLTGPAHGWIPSSLSHSWPTAMCS